MKWSPLSRFNLKSIWFVGCFVAAMTICVYVQSNAYGDIILGDVSREVIARSNLENNSSHNTTGGLFSASVTAAAPNVPPEEFVFSNQLSDIQLLSLAGNGDAGMGSNFGFTDAEAIADSYFSAFFVIIETHAYSLMGSLDNNGVLGLSPVSSFSLTGPSTNHSFTNMTPFGSVQFSESGLLTPGIYHVVASANMSGNDTNDTLGIGSYAFNLQLASIPEPSGIIILCVMLSGMCFAGRRKPRVYFVDQPEIDKRRKSSQIVRSTPATKK